MPTTFDLLLDRDVPHHTPDQLHGLACSLLEGEGADHAANRKDFTIWPLRRDRSGQVLRLTLLSDQDQRGRPVPRRLRLGSQFFEIRHRQDAFIPFARLAAGPPGRRVTLSFETPTYFSRNGRSMPLPDPALVFRSLAQRWNSHAPTALAIDESALASMLAGVYVRDVDIHTVLSSAAHRTERSGFIGTATFGLSSSASGSAGTFAALARAAEYIGVGAQTTRGFGVALEITR